MRRTTPLEKIRVRDLCSRALMNKSTFYYHYTDVFQLSDEIEQEALDRCFEHFQERDLLFPEPAAFLDAMQKALGSEVDVLKILSTGREDAQLAKIERKLYSLCLPEGLPEEEQYRIAFAIGGMIHVMQRFDPERRHDNPEVNRHISWLLRKLKD
ncbi:MAG: hypothetical protein ACI4O7_04535 [Aristaeellaceae bacterium]